jgi:hypothetical protein
MRLPGQWPSLPGLSRGALCPVMPAMPRLSRGSLCPPLPALPGLSPLALCPPLPALPGLGGNRAALRPLRSPGIRPCMPGHCRGMPTLAGHCRGFASTGQSSLPRRADPGRALPSGAVGAKQSPLALNHPLPGLPRGVEGGPPLDPLQKLAIPT